MKDNEPEKTNYPSSNSLSYFYTRGRWWCRFNFFFFSSCVLALRQGENPGETLFFPSRAGHWPIIAKAPFSLLNLFRSLARSLARPLNGTGKKERRGKWRRDLNGRQNVGRIAFIFSLFCLMELWFFFLGA